MISPKFYAVLDYTMGMLLIAAPWLVFAFIALPTVRARLSCLNP